MLPKLRSGSGLKVGVEFSVTVEGHLAQSFETDLRQRSQNPIPRLRERLGLTQEQFAAWLSDYLRGGAVARWESGQRIPGAYYCERLEALERGGAGVGNGEIPPWGGAKRRAPRYPEKAPKARMGRGRGSEDWSPRRRKGT